MSPTVPASEPPGEVALMTPASDWPPAPDPLIQPALHGAALLRGIANTGSHDLAVGWLGQSGYAFKWNGHVTYVDLYLSEHLKRK